MRQLLELVAQTQCHVAELQQELRLLSDMHQYAMHAHQSFVHGGMHPALGVYTPNMDMHAATWMHPHEAAQHTMAAHAAAAAVPSVSHNAPRSPVFVLSSPGGSVTLPLHQHMHAPATQLPLHGNLPYAQGVMHTHGALPNIRGAHVAPANAQMSGQVPAYQGGAYPQGVMSPLHVGHHASSNSTPVPGSAFPMPGGAASHAATISSANAHTQAVPVHGMHVPPMMMASPHGFPVGSPQHKYAMGVMSPTHGGMGHLAGANMHMAAGALQGGVPYAANNMAAVPGLVLSPMHGGPAYGMPLASPDMRRKALEDDLQAERDKNEMQTAVLQEMRDAVRRMEEEKNARNLPDWERVLRKQIAGWYSVEACLHLLCGTHSGHICNVCFYPYSKNSAEALAICREYVSSVLDAILKRI